MSVRTYNPSVRVGNWNEDVQLEEDTLKDFLARRERGELLIQQSASMKSSALGESSVSISRDGMVHFGDSFVLVNPHTASRGAAALSMSQSSGGNAGVSASSDASPSTRNTFFIASCDGSPEGDPVRYGQAFYITNAERNLFLMSDRATFSKCAKKSRHNEVSLSPCPGHLTEWKIQPFDPQVRMELEFAPAPANQKIILTHVKTNSHLCNEAEHTVKSPFGKEFEVSTFTSLDSHRAENDVNHWVFSMMTPGDGSIPQGPQ